MDRLLLSFVVPVYNVEKYLNECLDSIFDESADEDEFEVIAVNDGSTDSSAEILKTYAHHKNFQIITQENGGAGVARNNGIRHARGKYVDFIDSDDYLVSGATQILLDLARNSDCDIIEYNYASVDEQSMLLEDTETKTSEKLSIRSGRIAFVERPIFSPCFKLTKKDFITDNNLYFYPKIIYEDVEWSIKCFFLTNKTIFYPIKLYNYRIRSGSVTHSTLNSKNCLDLIKILELLADFRKEIDVNADNEKFLTILGDIMAQRMERAINYMYKFVPSSEKADAFLRLAKLRHLLGLATSKKGRRMYKLTRYLPDRIALKLYKIL